MEGLGDWEPARRICEEEYEFEDMNTDQVDVKNAFSLVFKPKKVHSLVGWEITSPLKASKQLHRQK